MDAKICDRCGAMWTDSSGCNIYVATLYLSNGPSHSDHIGSYDLCHECRKGLFGYLAPVTLPADPKKKVTDIKPAKNKEAKKRGRPRKHQPAENNKPYQRKQVSEDETETEAEEWTGGLRF